MEWHSTTIVVAGVVGANANDDEAVVELLNSGCSNHR